MSLRNSLVLFLAFFLTVSFVYADHSKQHKPVACAAYDKDYNVGDRGPANGWIIYKKPAATGQSTDTCWQYLETAPFDQEKVSTWSNVTNDVVGVGQTSTKVGNGKDNTQNILTQDDHTQSAAKICDDLVVKFDGKKFKDWFLPSRDELDLMYQLLKKGNNKDSFKYNWYWSSSESGYTTAWFQYFPEGKQLEGAKSAAYYVHCVRAF